MNNNSKFKFYILNKSTLESKKIEKVYIMPYMLGRITRNYVLIIDNIETLETVIFKWPQKDGRYDVLYMEKELDKFLLVLENNNVR